MTKNTRFSPEVRQQAVRIVLESQGEYDSQWATTALKNAAKLRSIQMPCQRQ